jgi:predicted enzyme related to lactoylglutathione lyase
MTTYTLGYTNIYVADFDRAFRFYTETLGLTAGLKDEKFGYASFATKGAQLAIALSEGDHAHLVGRHTGVGLMVEDLDATFAELAGKGVTFPMKPEKQPWGGYMGLMEDSEGNILYLDQLRTHG